MQTRRSLALTGAALLLTLSIGTASADPTLANLRVAGLAVQQNLSVSSADLGRDYKVLIDFASDLPLDRVLFEVRWQDGRVSTIQEGAFSIVPTSPTTGTLVIQSSVFKSRMPRSIDWWVEDNGGTPSNKLTQQVVIQ